MGIPIDGDGLDSSNDNKRRVFQNSMKFHRHMSTLPVKLNFS